MIAGGHGQLELTNLLQTKNEAKWCMDLSRAKAILLVIDPPKNVLLYFL